MVKQLLVAVLRSAAGHHYYHEHGAFLRRFVAGGVGQGAAERSVVSRVGERYLLRFVRIRLFRRLRSVAFHRSRLQREGERHAVLTETALQQAVFQLAFIRRIDGLHGDFHLRAAGHRYFRRYAFDALVGTVHGAGERSAVAFGYVEHEV